MIVGTALSWTPKAWAPVHALAWDVPLIGHVDLGGSAFAAYNGLTAVVVNVVVAAVAVARHGARKAADQTVAGRLRGQRRRGVRRLA